MKLLQLFALLSFLVFYSSAAMGQTRAHTKKIEKIKKIVPPPSPSPSGVGRSSNAPSHSKKNTIIQNIINNMVYVEGGTFIMGATPEQGNDAGKDEKPAHQVMVASFSIGKYEVTQEEWMAVMNNNPSHFKGNKRPVEQISWNDCLTFLNKLNKLTGKQFRLPTEAEWEYAARGGNLSKNNKFAGSNNPYEVAWFNENSNNETHDVGTKLSNELGLFDMAGNVWEWCSDYKLDYNSSVENPRDNNRVNRGGCFKSGESPCRVSFRSDDNADDSYNSLGFRLAL